MRGPWLAAIAFVIGALAAGILLSGGRVPDPFSSATPDAIAVRVTNVGSERAELSGTFGPATGTPTFRWAATLDPGEAEEQRIELRSNLPILVTVKATRSVPGSTAEGQTSKLVRDGECARGVEPLVSISLDTTRGISFPEARVRC